MHCEQALASTLRCEADSLRVQSETPRWQEHSLKSPVVVSRLLFTLGHKLGISYGPGALRDHLDRDTALALELAVVYMRTSTASTVKSSRHSNSSSTSTR